MPILTEQSSIDKYKVTRLWEDNFGYSFNRLLACRVFRDASLSLVTANENGNVRVHNTIFKDDRICGFEKSAGARSYETKGGPIHSLLVHNITKFNSEDVLVGDSNGTLSIITNGQILNRRSLCTGNITAIVIDTDSVGNMSIVMGSSCGTVVAVTPYDVLWKCRLSEVLKQDEQANSENRVSITAVHRYHLQSSTSDASYVMVADSEKRVHLVQNGRLVMTIPVASVVTSMCSGYFINDGGVKGDDQVMLATKSGALFVFTNSFNVLLYANLSYPITNVALLSATGAEDVDAVVCTGYFNKLCVLQNKLCVCSYESNDWIHTFDMIYEHKGTGTGTGDLPLLVIGCLDGSLKLLKLTKVA